MVLLVVYKHVLQVAEKMVLRLHSIRVLLAVWKTGVAILCKAWSQGKMVHMLTQKNCIIGC